MSANSAGEPIATPDFLAAYAAVSEQAARADAVSQHPLSFFEMTVAMAYQAFADHGVVAENTVEADLDDAWQILCDLEAVGIDLDCVTWQLQHEGVQTFLDPFDDLMDTLAQKCS